MSGRRALQQHAPLHYTARYTLHTVHRAHALHKMPILFATTLYTMAPTISASPPRRASGGILSRAWRIRANLRISCPRCGSRSSA